MEDKKTIDTLYGLLVIVVLVIGILGINGLNRQIANEEIERQVTTQYLLQQKNARIKMLSAQVEDLKQKLAGTKSDLDAISRRLAAPAAEPVSVPVVK